MSNGNYNKTGGNEMNKQIGWFILHEDTEFTNTYECAAWYENVLVKAGKYPMEVPEFYIKETDDGKEVYGHIDMIGVLLPGIITSDEFGARFCGVPVGIYDNSQNKGKESTHYFRTRLYSVADVILHPDRSIHRNKKWEYELFPEYEARDIYFEYDGEQHVTHGIFQR